MSLRASASRFASGLRSLGRGLVARQEAVGDIAWRIGAAGSLVLIVLLVHRSAYSLVIGAPNYQVPKSTARARVAPSWADPAAAESVVTLPAGRDTLLDSDFVRRVAASFSDNPWVRRVVAVERAFPDQVRVRLEMRSPRLAVRRPGGLVLVDQDGVRLPGTYAKAPTLVTEVAGIASAPPAPGRTWEGLEIATALEMASLAEGEAVLRRLGIRVVDVANLNGRRDPKSPDLLLVTSTGAVIDWGRAPSAARYGEPALAEKLDNLRRAAENYPRLEGVASVRIHQKGPARVKPVDAGVVRRTR